MKIISKEDREALQQRIVNMKAKGYSLKEVSDILLKEGVQTAMGNAFTYAVVSAFFNNHRASISLMDPNSDPVPPKIPSNPINEMILEKKNKRVKAYRRSKKMELPSEVIQKKLPEPKVSLVSAKEVAECILQISNFNNVSDGMKEKLFDALLNFKLKE